jgi:hypothetical protein
MRAFRAVATMGAGLLVLVSVARTGKSTPLGVALQGEGGTVTGSVKFVGKAPPNPELDMSEEPQCAAKYKTTPRDPIVVVNPNGTLANVFVYVKQGLPADATYPPPTTAAVIDQSGCEYHPRVFGIMVGQPLDIKNSDPLMHNIKTHPKQNRPFNVSQPTAGMSLTRTFTDPEVMLPFECNVHGWMHAYAGVLSHPFYAVTGTPDGRFSITGLPPGTYTIEAWHERYGTRTATVTVQKNETKTVDLTYTAQ